MSRAAILILMLCMTGCATCERHKVACGVVAASIALSVPSMVHTGGNHTTYLGSPPDVTTQPVNCHTVGCL